MYLDWQSIQYFYSYNCTSNNDFLVKYNTIPIIKYDSNNYKSIYGTNIQNFDMIKSINQVEELKDLFINNNLIAFRPGCIESSFLLKYYFNMDLNTHIHYVHNDIDYHIKNNAGLYYKNINRKKEVLDWWCENYIDLLNNSTFTSCYIALHFDIPLMAKLNLKGKYYSCNHLYRIILENSENKKILYVGNNILSIKTGYERDLKKLWKFPVSNFSMYYLQTPQTTLGMEYPHDTMIETCDELINIINEKYNDFDTAIFSCGAYGSSLINILRKLYPNKNLLYLGSDCFRMFGCYSHMQKWQDIEPPENFNKEHVFEVLEELPEGCKNHPEKKYWKKS